MPTFFSSTLLLTILLAIGLGFFLRAASKDRTTIVDIYSPLPPLDVLNGITSWLVDRGWKANGGNAERQVLRFSGNVSSSNFLTVLLTIFGAIGACCLGLVLRELYPILDWWPLLLAGLGGPIAGLVYRSRSARIEDLEIRLLNDAETKGSTLRVRAHRDELIAMELELAESFQLASDGSLLSSPI